MTTVSLGPVGNLAEGAGKRFDVDGENGVPKRSDDPLRFVPRRGIARTRRLDMGSRASHELSTGRLAPLERHHQGHRDVLSQLACVVDAQCALSEHRLWKPRADIGLAPRPGRLKSIQA